MESCNTRCPIQRFFRSLLRYTLVTFGLVCAFCFLLYLTGLGGEGVQARINANVETSVKQFKEEGIYPRPINALDYSYRLDNYTDTIILQESLLMNTLTDPASIFSNPRVSNTYEDSKYHALILDLEEAAKGAAGNANYANYWIGIRALIRPLLTILPYQNIRGVIALMFLALWMTSTASVSKAAGKPFAAAYFVAVACINIPIVVSEIQFIPCFVLMFIAMHALTRLRLQHAPLLFFITGACTQFFDFYTYPVVTLGFPLILLIALTRSSEVRKRMALLGRCAAAWFIAYVLLWLIRLVLVQVFTGVDAASYAFGKLGIWTGAVADERYVKYTPLHVLRLISGTFLQPHNVFFLAVCGVIYAVGLVRGLVKKQVNAPSLLYLAVGVLPVIWSCIASRATGNHFWFQYRLLTVSLFALAALLAETLQPHSIGKHSKA